MLNSTQTHKSILKAYYPLFTTLGSSNNTHFDEMIPPRPMAPPLPEASPRTPEKKAFCVPSAHQKGASISPPKSFRGAPSQEEPDTFHTSFSEITISEAKRQRPASNIKTAAALLGPNYKTALKKQGTIEDCYLVAVFDAIAHSPAGDAILKQIQIEKRPSPALEDELIYTVRFPSGLTGKVIASEIGKKRNNKEFLQGHWAWQLLELAYAKATRSERNQKRVNPFEDEGRGFTPLIVEGGIAKDALFDMLSGEPEQVTSEDGIPFSESRIDSFAENPHGYDHLIDFLRRAAEDTEHHYILTASATIPSPGQDSAQQNSSTSKRQSHAYSIRTFNIDDAIEESTITVADPRDLQKDYTLPLKDFCAVFWRVSGIKLPLAPTQTETKFFPHIEMPTPFKL